MRETLHKQIGREAAAASRQKPRTTFIRVCPYCLEGRARVPVAWNNRKRTVTFAHRHCIPKS
jgi:hypothetical protein